MSVKLKNHFFLNTLIATTSKTNGQDVVGIANAESSNDLTIESSI